MDYGCAVRGCPTARRNKNAAHVYFSGPTFVIIILIAGKILGNHKSISGNFDESAATEPFSVSRIF